MQVLGLAGGAANSTLQLVLMLLLLVLLALDPRSHQRLVVAVTPSFYRQRMQELLHNCREALGRWLAGLTLSAVAVFPRPLAVLVLLMVPPLASVTAPTLSEKVVKASTAVAPSTVTPPVLITLLAP